ncbi:DndB, partial [Pseudomonas sp. MPR-R2A5]|uniref:DNA sulfur modification protein DndB n=1 Tax=Pseudomonas sp. MPR-R2A5 TaxID=2070622 RepID=UPI000CBE2019
MPDSVRDTVGVLHLTGQESLFAVDGQHRVEGIKGALARSGKVSGHELTVILVAHRNTASGLQRTRRLFSTLNRYAKPVTPGEIVALDE